MRRIDYKGEEYLIHTRSGMRMIDALREQGIPVECQCSGKNAEPGKCVVKWPKDTQFLLTAPTELEQKVLGDEITRGNRLACQAIIK